MYTKQVLLLSTPNVPILRSMPLKLSHKLPHLFTKRPRQRGKPEALSYREKNGDLGLHLRDNRFAETDASDLTAVKNRCPTPDSIKRIAPDVTSAKNLCSTAYGYGAGAVTQMDKAVRGNLNHYLGDTEGRAKIVRFSSSIVKHTAHESLKTVPGYKIVARSIRDLNESDNHEVDVKAMQADIRKLKKEFSEYRKVHEPEVDVKALQPDVVRKRHKQVQLDKPSVDLKSPNTANIHSVANQKLMKELDLFS